MSQYISDKMSYRIDALQRFIQSNQPLMLLIGQTGSGKQALLGQFAQQAAAHYSILTIDAATVDQPQHLVNVCYQHWQFTMDLDLKGPRQQLDDLLDQMQHAALHGVLIITNAQQLSLAVLAAIVHMHYRQAEVAVVLHIILVGACELKNKMLNFMLQVPPYLLLQPLNQDETMQYVQQRLIQLTQRRLSLSTVQLQEIYQQSNGAINVIDRLLEKWVCQQVLVGNNQIITEQQVAPRFWQRYRVSLIAMSGLLLLGIGSWLYQHHLLNRQFFSLHAPQQHMKPVLQFELPATLIPLSEPAKPRLRSAIWGDSRSRSLGAA